MWARVAIGHPPVMSPSVNGIQYEVALLYISFERHNHTLFSGGLVLTVRNLGLMFILLQ